MRSKSLTIFVVFSFVLTFAPRFSVVRFHLAMNTKAYFFYWKANDVDIPSCYSHGKAWKHEEGVLWMSLGKLHNINVRFFEQILELIRFFFSTDGEEL